MTQQVNTAPMFHLRSRPPRDQSCSQRRRDSPKYNLLICV